MAGDSMKSGRAAAATAYTGGALLFLSAACYGYIIGKSWMYTSASVAVSTGGLEMFFSPSLLTTLLYLLPLCTLIAAAVLAVAGGKCRRRTPVFWSLAMLVIAGMAYELLPPNAFAVSYYVLYRSYPLLQGLAAHGITLSGLFYLLGLILLLVFMGICPSHKKVRHCKEKMKK